MDPIRFLIHGLIAGLAAVCGGSAAQACFYNVPVCIGSRSYCHPTPRQRLIQERESAVEEVRRLTIEGRHRLRSDEVDAAAELAEWLVPNVRPEFAIETSCGMMGQADHGEGRETGESLFRDIVAGTEFADGGADDFAVFRRGDGGYSFGAPCNAEYRESFARHLRESLSPGEVEDAWLFLRARRQGDYPRLVSFRGGARTPPVHWILHHEILDGQVRRYLRARPAGRAIAAAMDRFWAERGPDLSDDLRTCPAARRQWAQDRDEALAAMREELQRREARRGATDR